MKVNKELMQKKLDEIATKYNISLSLCPVCHTHSLSWNTTIFELREFNQGNLVVGRGNSLIPVVAATCKACGHVVLFNAISLGLIDPKTGAVINDERNEQKNDNQN